ncbi:MAG: UDP-N-acetylmuramate dehydrogenase [bacterium]|nr:UDP-N-acetylmuramate dehydrogenase [bacterium]MDZ4285486.1 UDP-N-acetylmuramate dehydrogenase [Candidatus Sungbacteria bacterium]
MADIKENISLAPYTIYKIGGMARFFVDAVNAEDIKEAALFAAGKHIPFVLIGAGSNVLVSDKGFDGLVIRMNGGSVSVDGERMRIDAGVMMARAVMESGKASLHGFEWGIGVPGTMGGSVRGNAGCFGGETKDVIEFVEVFSTKTKEIKIFSNKDCVFGYRESVFKTHPEWIIISAILKLQKGNADDIQQEILRITRARVAKQDIGAKCCGCIFKNVPWPESEEDRDALTRQFPELAVFRNRATIPSAFLIDHAGLKGRMSGNICISDKHANFFVNKGSGTSDEVLALIKEAKEEVKKKFGIELYEEIYMIGF